MKPYGGREQKLKGWGKWKKDYHPKPKRKFINWWEGILQPLSKGRIKQLWKKQIKKELEL